MKRKYMWKAMRPWILLTLFVLCMGCLAVTNSFARFETTAKQEIPFEVRSTGQFKITGLEDQIFEEMNWTLQEDESWQFSFRVTNQEDDEPNLYDEAFRLRIASTIGLYVDEADISLIVEETNGKQRTYKGVPKLFVEDSAYYEELGEGAEYLFYDMDGEELRFVLSGGKLSEQIFTISVEGAVTPSLLEIFLAEIPADF